MQPRDGVAQRQPRAHRSTPRFAVKVAQSRERFADGGKSRLLRPGAGLAVTRDAQHDEPRIQLVQGFPRQAPLFHRAGAEILDQYVRVLRQPAHNLLPLALAQVYANGFLAAGLGFPPDGRALRQSTPLAQRASETGRLDFYDFSAEVGEGFGGERACDQLTELNDLDTRQDLAGHACSYL